MFAESKDMTQDSEVHTLNAAHKHREGAEHKFESLLLMTWSVWHWVLNPCAQHTNSLLEWECFYPGTIVLFLSTDKCILLSGVVRIVVCLSNQLIALDFY